jgi:PIN domain nuclease of toxin-antitoxin system
LLLVKPLKKLILILNFVVLRFMFWSANGSEYLSARVCEAIADESNRVFVSVASVWEIQIKMQLGKLILYESMMLSPPLKKGGQRGFLFLSVTGQLLITRHNLSH